MKKFLFCLLVLAASIPFARAVSLSDSARISLLTCAPGAELYAAFGHTAIRVTDYKNDFDVVFNYGTFDFEQPGFYTNFVRGKMRYMLATDRFDDFRRQYIYEGRSITEQTLNLAPADQQRIFSFLYENAKPENREYLYDFFWDNCSTRPRDVFEKTLGKRLNYDYSVLPENTTMRGTLKPYVAHLPWIDLGFDLILGLPCDIKATARHQTFLPDRLMRLMENAQLDGRPLVASTEKILDLPDARPAFAGIPPIYVTFMLLVAGIGVIFLERWRKTHFWKFDFILFATAGVMGFFFLGMWLFTSHYSVPKNLNVLWLFPLHLPVAFTLLRDKKPFWLPLYFFLTFISLILSLLSWKWLPQPFHLAVLPVMLLLANRALRIFLSVKLQMAHEQTAY